MKHSIALKFVAVILCALSLVGAVASGVGIIVMQGYGLYNKTLEDVKDEQLENVGYGIADHYAEYQAVISLSNCPSDLVDSLYENSYYEYNYFGRYAVDVYEDGEVVCSVNSGEDYDGQPLEYTIAPAYPIVSSTYTYNITEDYYDGSIDATMALDEDYGESSAATEVPVPDDALVTEPAQEQANEPAVASADASAKMALERVKGKEILYSESYSTGYYDDITGHKEVVYNLDYYQGPAYTVKVYLDETSVLGGDFAMVSALYPYRSQLIPALLVSLLAFAAALVYLCAVAGRNTSGQIRLAALNRIPIDLYALCIAGGIILLCMPVSVVIESFYGYNKLAGNVQLCALILGLCGFGIALLAIGFVYALAAQLKVKDGYWWRHSICGWCLLQLLRFCRWIGGGCRLIGRGLAAVFELLPVIWQWLLTAFIMVFCVVVFFFLWACNYGAAAMFFCLLTILSVIACTGIVCYGGYCFGALLKGAKYMAQGHLDHKINTKHLYGCFKDFGDQLNNLAEGAKIAAERQMKSERMKTELITNVSHDIKTPLTSIINYVDLLKKPHNEAEGAQYLDVLDRQSQRLKKLIDDLMEMSKASTGNLAVELGRVDAVEAVNQALGEFADKLASANLTPVFRYPDFPVTMIADGRLVWRVLSNILSNAVKYALPDTRLYIDLMVLQGNAVIAIKNISRDQLNVNADELMERFVRGDSSRNTEGSGLGLNIAKSLVELQHGQMHLMVDGDLFKVTLIFPCN